MYYSYDEIAEIVKERYPAVPALKRREVAERLLIAVRTTQHTLEELLKPIARSHGIEG